MSEKKYSDFQIFWRFILMAKAYWLHLTGIFALELLAVPLVLLLPIPVKIAVDSVVGSEPLPSALQLIIPQSFQDSAMSILWVAVALQVLVVLCMQLEFMFGYVLQTYTGEKLKLTFRQQLFRHVQRLSFSFHDSRGTADSIFRIQYDAMSIQHILIQGMIPLISAVLKLLGMVTVILMINVQLALVAFSVIPFLYFLASQYNRKMRRRYNRVQQIESKVLGVIQEVMTSFRVVKAFGREECEQKRFTEGSNEAVSKKIELSYMEGLFSVVVNVITAFGTAAVIFIGTSNVLKQNITLGELLMVITYLSQLYGPLKSISQQVTSLQSSFAGGQRSLELLDENPDVIEKPHAKHIRRAKGQIQYEDVSFYYDPQMPVLKNVSFEVKSGSRVGIKGSTGAGKTTLISLLVRFYDPVKGRVVLDGLDVKDYKLTDLRNQFSLVLQDSILFSTTIAENILYAKPEASQDDVVAAAKAANAHEFIMNLPDGYNTMVGEHGMKLSGGERQRISLARAFLKDAPILLLDEPTSAVDTKTETLIMDAMQRLMKNRTTFMIAHRLSTLDQCDVLLEVSDGQIKVIESDNVDNNVEVVS